VGNLDASQKKLDDTISNRIYGKGFQFQSSILKNEKNLRVLVSGRIQNNSLQSLLNLLFGAGTIQNLACCRRFRRLFLLYHQGCNSV
jgi:hypothetical protein